MSRLSFEDIKANIDLVEYLDYLGHRPAKIRANNYWYHSPLRMERTPSFKVDRLKQLWFDFGMGKGGTVIDFAMLYFECDLAAVAEKLESSAKVQNYASVPLAERTIVDSDEGKVTILREETLSAPALLAYLKTRGIPMNIARKHCSEVHYQVNKREYFAIGFKNRSGGYELRNPYFKISSSPKDITFIDNGSDQLAMFEGCFDFLSYLALEPKYQQSASNFLVLNSVSLIEKARPFFERHHEINLYLDRDSTGRKLTELLMETDGKFKDRSALYARFKDLNEWLAPPVSRPVRVYRRSR
ncbi:CHC2 zinc finger domain-containing protein [Chitinophaga sedimenti]|uniref:toprim domain-containing protein n=1 Tax=Chitinophaga sedimenti TaxID=2033606 RepID=UPI0020056418|nr:toprim domain-containing protein [Chitinophaga sedimenti]MCK7557964.1 CHC2 zinc finger domain-containing protein [Chitinophaga sedimenti]